MWWCGGAVGAVGGVVGGIVGAVGGGGAVGDDAETDCSLCAAQHLSSKLLR